MLLRQCFQQRWNSVCTQSVFKCLDGKLEIGTQELQNAKAKSEQVEVQFNKLKDVVAKGGGEKAVERVTKHHKKLMVHDKLKCLLDPDSDLLHIGSFAGLGMEYGDVPAAGIVTVIGKIHGQYCVISCNDASVKGGAMYPISVRKQCRMQDIAGQNRLPAVYLLDSAGAFLPLQSEIFPGRNHGGRMFYSEAVMAADGIPQIAVVCGSCTAGGAYAPTMASETVIVDKLAMLFLAGPPLVKAATGEVVTSEELGGASLHCRVSGCTDYFATTEEEAFSVCRDIVVTLNTNPPPSKETAAPSHSQDELDIIAGLPHIDRTLMYNVLARILDNSRFHEFKTEYGSNLITGYGFISGHLVGIVANVGSPTRKDGQKGAHFIRQADLRNVPLIFLQNSGKQLDPVTSHDGELVKERAKLIGAIASSSCPKLTINIGGCYSDDNYTMCGLSGNPNFTFMWPSVSSSVHEFTDKEVEPSPPSKVSAFSFPVTSAFYSASRLYTDEIILPRHTRRVISTCLEVFRHRLPENRRRQAILRM